VIPAARVPEGHSLELAARRLAPLVGREVLEGPLAGARVTAVEARGKHLLIHADDGRSADVHLGMHGGVRLLPAGGGATRAALNCAVIRTAAGDAVLVGRLRVGRSSRRPRLGPDLLHGRFDAREYLRRARLVDRPVAEVLLDQRVVAGIGNIVRCEVLHREAVDPFASVSALSDRTLLRLAVGSRALLRAGVDDRGRLARVIYRRAGQPCPRCHHPIESRPVGEQRRRLYWCAGCQVRAT
jgi:formamidopyrimidine-DNA glycosylase